MRKPFKARMMTTKRKRQAFLAAILFAASPMWTGSTLTANDFFARPPLPIATATHAPAGTTDVKVNPFCLPAIVESADPIRLASGTKSPTAPEGTRMRLQAIGEAIGLHEIGHGPVAKTDMPAIEIQSPAPSQVQSNPLVDRILNGPASPNLPGGESVKAGLGKPVAGLSARRAASQTSERTLPPEPTVVSEQNSSIVLLSRPEFKPAAEEVEAISQEPVVVAEPQEDTEPVFFSFSDNDSSEANLDETASLDETANLDETASLDETAESVESDQLASEPSDFAAALSQEKPEASEPSPSESLPSQPVGLSVTTEAKPMHGVGGIQHNDFVDELKRYADEIDSQTRSANNRIAKHEPIAGEALTKPEPSLHSRRYRPPVAVHPVPIDFDGSESNPADASIGSVVTSAPGLSENTVDVSSGNTDADLVENAGDSSAAATTLYMNLAQVRSLTLGAELQSVRIADKSVCQAFAAGPNQLKLIGTGNGTTRLVVYAKPVPGQSEPRVRSFDIHVEEASKVNTESTEVRTEILNQTIQQTFPDADVVVRRSGNELVVMGRCGSEAVAKKIVRLVRRTCLVPVKDQLRVR